MSIVGHYDAVVVHADNSALEFFQRYGFTDDIILNSRWRFVINASLFVVLINHGRRDAVGIWAVRFTITVLPYLTKVGC